MERKYMMYEGEDVNTIDLLYSAETTEPNGVKIIVPIKYSDRVDFFNKIREQLAYFENVYFDVELQGYGFSIPNDFLIHRAESFQFSELSSDRNMHICLDNVYYPLDFEKLGISRIDLPVALRFSITDGLFPTPNRESIRYTKEAKELILAKIKDVADYYAVKFNESITSKANVKDILDYYSSKNRYVKFNERIKEVTELFTHTTIPLVVPKMEGVDLIDFAKLYLVKDYILGEYNINYSLQNDRMKQEKGYWSNNVNLRTLDNSHYYIYTDRIGGNMKAYLKEQVNKSDTYYFIKKVKKI